MVTMMLFTVLPGIQCTTIQLFNSYDRFLFSGSKDKTIRMWDIATGECIRKFKGHRQPIRCLLIDKNSLFSASSDKTVKEWNIYTGECLKTFKGHEVQIQIYINKCNKKGEVFDLAITGPNLYSASRDKSVKLWNVATGVKVHSFRGHESTVYCVAASENYMYSGSADKTIIQWDVHNRTVLRTFRYLL